METLENLGNSSATDGQDTPATDRVSDEFAANLEKFRRLAKREVDERFCVARTWKGLQCERKRVLPSQFCTEHGKKAAVGFLKYGRCDTCMEPEKLERLLRNAAKNDQTKPCKYYSRLHMWHYASKCGVDNIEDLTDEDFTICLNRTDTYLRTHPEVRTSWKLEEHKGPTTVDERSDSSKVNYCGAPKTLKYYSKQMFLKKLTLINNGTELLPSEATERQFMDALAETSLDMQGKNCVRASKFRIFEYRGPQCLPHRNDLERLAFEPNDEAERTHRGGQKYQSGIFFWMD